MDGSTGTDGLYYDQSSGRLYWTYGYYYNATYPYNPSIGYSTLNDATGVATGVGAWSLTGRQEKFDRGGVPQIPQWFANRYTGGDTLAVGFGGYFAIDRRRQLRPGPGGDRRRRTRASTRTTPRWPTCRCWATPSAPGPRPPRHRLHQLLRERDLPDHPGHVEPGQRHGLLDLERPHWPRRHLDRHAHHAGRPVHRQGGPGRRLLPEFRPPRPVPAPSSGWSTTRRTSPRWPPAPSSSGRSSRSTSGRPRRCRSPTATSMASPADGASMVAGVVFDPTTNQLYVLVNGCGQERRRGSNGTRRSTSFRWGRPPPPTTPGTPGRDGRPAGLLGNGTGLDGFAVRLPGRDDASQQRGAGRGHSDLEGLRAGRRTGTRCRWTGTASQQQHRRPPSTRSTTDRRS